MRSTKTSSRRTCTSAQACMRDTKCANTERRGEGGDLELLEQGGAGGVPRRGRSDTRVQAGRLAYACGTRKPPRQRRRSIARRKQRSALQHPPTWRSARGSGMLPPRSESRRPAAASRASARTRQRGSTHRDVSTLRSCQRRSCAQSEFEACAPYIAQDSPDDAQRIRVEPDLLVAETER
eukprot:338322-Prymnesium_polylepis.2